MSATNRPCQWTSRLWPDYRCPEPALPNSKNAYCIFHEKEKDAEEFKRRVREKFENKDFDFKGYYFPGDADFGEATFERDAYFGEATFERDAYFRETTFKGGAYFEKATFEGGADLEKATFEGGADFSEATFERDAFFREATFEEYAYFEKATFKWGAYFEKATFKGDADFLKATFEDKAYFWETTFEEGTHFWETTFKWIAYFEKATFKWGADFSEATFERDAFFSEATFEDNVGFLIANFRRIVDFENAKFKRSKDKEIAYRLSKTSYQKGGQYDKVGDCYYEERLARWQGLKWWPPTSFLKKLAELLFLRLTCGYGERPYFVFGWAFGIISLFAVLYYQIGHIVSISPGYIFEIGDAIYFSVATFVTLGFGGPWYPSPDHWIKYLVMSEAFIGVFLMALFVMTFGRRMMR